MVDICFPGMPPQLPLSSSPKGKAKALDAEGDVAMTNGHSNGPDADSDTWVALISGLDMQGAQGRADVRAQVLAEYLTGESAGDAERTTSKRIARVIIAGNAFAEPEREVETTKKPVRGIVTVADRQC